MAASLHLGSIVWVEVPDPNGFFKLRPAVIVTPTEQITASERLHIVAITSRLSEPLPDGYVLLPWHAQGHPRTGLNRRCAAVCSWLVEIKRADVRDVGGIVPGPVMVEILRQIAGKVSPSNPPPNRTRNGGDAAGGNKNRA